MTKDETRSHVAKVLGTVERGVATGAVQDDWLQQSWLRSVAHHRLDPGRPSYRKVLSAAELREAAERSGLLLDLARPHVDELDRQVAGADYCILLTDSEGLTLDYRNRHDPDKVFKRAGVRVGICWSEASEGTCGIGTAIVNRTPVLVHKTEHFRADNIPLSCSAAPVFGLDDELLAVLDASTLCSPYQRDSQALVFNLVKEKALLIENAYAEHALRDHWRLSFWPGARTGAWTAQADLLLAFDGSGRILAANRPARWFLSRLGAGSLGTLDEVFGCSAESLLALSHSAPGAAVPLRIAASGELMHGMLRAPQRALSSSSAPLRIVAPPAAPKGFERLTTTDPVMQALVTRGRRVVDRQLPIMLLGETGTGKEAFAQALHAASRRAEHAFVALNCAAIPESLIESELFGYRDGAFTGARSRGAKGKILQADQGSLFLDEIGDMPLLLQSRLLRVLAEGEVLPLGAEEPMPVRLNVICATHQDLSQLIAQGRFREDLYYRLSGAVFELPPLRLRSDQAELIRHVLREEAQAAGMPQLRLEPEALERLLRCPWPGNIRQLRHALRYACALCEDLRLRVADFPAHLLEGAAAHEAVAEAPARHAPPAEPARLASPPAMPTATGELPALPDELQAVRQQMLDMLKQTRWHISAAATALAMPRSTFYRRMKALGIVAPHRL
jgi:transcriptional regulator of acetoin/glycerol metabolism